MKIWFALLAATAICRAENLEQTYAPYGRLLITPFASAPFPHPSRAAGHQYKDKFFPAETHYRDNSVALFIPKGFRETPRVDVVVYFHGWGSSIESTLRRFQLVEQFTASGKNAVLVFPEGPKHASDSAGGKLEDPEGFKRFVTELTATLRRQAGGQPSTQEIGRVILADTAGAYKVMAAILDRGGLPERCGRCGCSTRCMPRPINSSRGGDREPGRLSTFTPRTAARNAIGSLDGTAETTRHALSVHLGHRRHRGGIEIGPADFSLHRSGPQRRGGETEDVW